MHGPQHPQSKLSDALVTLRKESIQSFLAVTSHRDVHDTFTQRIRADLRQLHIQDEAHRKAHDTISRRIEENISQLKTQSDAQCERHHAFVQEVQESLNDIEIELEAVENIPKDGPPPLGPKIPIWVLIREYLKTVGGDDTPQNIRDALQDAGHILGKNPLRNIIISVTNKNMKAIFEVEKVAMNSSETRTSRIKLVDKGVQYRPNSYRYKERTDKNDK